MSIDKTFSENGKIVKGDMILIPKGTKNVPFLDDLVFENDVIVEADSCSCPKFVMIRLGDKFYRYNREDVKKVKDTFY